ncbi:hypothetical protein BC829DRAFT_408344 [Chytridium lagenaria]|nr:hypothetical protein BC829DRAFT_408344 [Chytridium lagenaria]
MTLKLYDIIFDPDSPDRSFYRSPNPWKILSTSLSTRKGSKATCPALELEDGTIICDSYRIAEYLESTYPDTPSIFTGNTTIPPNEAEITLGKAYARLIDVGLGDSDPQWAIWLELILPELINSPVPGTENYVYYTSKWSQAELQNIMETASDRFALIERAKLNILPIAAVLRERAGRNCNPVIAKEVWEDTAVEIKAWVERMVERFPEIKGHLRPYDT